MAPEVSAKFTIEKVVSASPPRGSEIRIERQCPLIGGSCPPVILNRWLWNNCLPRRYSLYTSGLTARCHGSLPGMSRTLSASTTALEISSWTAKTPSALGRKSSTKRDNHRPRSSAGPRYERGCLPYEKASSRIWAGTAVAGDDKRLPGKCGWERPAQSESWSRWGKKLHIVDSGSPPRRLSAEDRIQNWFMVAYRLNVRWF